MRLGHPVDVPLVGCGNPAYGTSVAVAVADLEGNGRLDVVVVDALGPVVEVLLFK